MIERQYIKEIDRRKKAAEREKLGEESKDLIDSPLRRAREYAISLGGSPSPLRKMRTVKDQYAFQISPEKTTIELRMN